MSEHGGTHSQGGGLQPRERSAALPATNSPAPREPFFAPTGNVALDALGSLANRAIEPWQELPTQTPVQKAATIVNGVLGVLNMDIAVDAFNMGVGALSSLIPWPSLPAAVLGMPHIGTPHTHPHPPSLVPPAPPVPLPSIGTVAVGGCVSVMIGGMPAARAGDLGLAMTCGTLAPPFEIAMGSSSVFIGGSRAARMGDMTKHCGAAMPSEFSAIGTGFMVAVGLLNAAAAPDANAVAMAAAQTAADTAKAAVAALMGTDPGAPPCMGAVMMGIPTVLIGGFPIPPIENFARAFFQKLMKPLAGVLHSLVGKTLGEGRLANFFHELVCHTTGHPVDVASGRVLTSAVDLRLPGPIPLEFKRRYATSWSDREGPLGWGWSHSFDQAVWLEGDKVVFLAEDGREIEFEATVEAQRPAWLKSNERWDRFNRLTLRSLARSQWEIDSPDGLTREFEPVGIVASPGRSGLARLTRIRDRAGNAIALGYDGSGYLSTIIDSGGRELRLENDRSGRLKRVMVPHPTANGWVEQSRYAYSAMGDLIEVVDPLGHSFQMEYVGHLLARETNRNGLSFYFVYEGGGTEARCVKTWGDGGIYSRKLVYDLVNHVTVSTDSYGNDTFYQMNGDNAVVSVKDALGGVTRYAFDQSYQKVSEIDPNGCETQWDFDERGNCVKVTSPDGASAKMEYNDRNQLVYAVDPVKGEWHWGYDLSGLLINRIDPMQRRVRFVWKRDDKSPRQLISMIDPAGQATELEYDRQSNLIAVSNPDGTVFRWKYDQLGHCTAAIDQRGNVQQRQHDAMGRVTVLQEPDGNVLQIEFDAESNVLRARDQQHDVRFTYQGMGRLKSRTEARQTVTFEYDLEERLITLANEKGDAYRFERGPTGSLVAETQLDGTRREYRHDPGGRVTTVLRPDRRRTDYKYDRGSRMIEAKYSDGTADAFTYRADGILVGAKNDAAQVSFERDKIGRVVKEVVGDDWVASDYDVLGARIEVRSSKGLKQEIHRSGMSAVVAVHARTADNDNRWQANFRRDQAGLEVERALPGGIRSQWERDHLGRARTHTIWSGELSKAAWHYTWDVNERLVKIVDLLVGPIRYHHDPLGTLVAAAYADGRVDLRVPDAVGNLFRTEDRRDRKYGPAGQLLEASDAAGDKTLYEYDPEGNLAKKTEPNGGVWSYHWSGAGRLAKVVRPDGDAVEFAYDAMGRRLWKRFRSRTTRWIWDGNVPLHEWVEEAAPEASTDAAPVLEVVVDEIAARRRRAELNERPAQGPPAANGSRSRFPGGTAENPITWLFDPETFAPMARLAGESRHAIVTDHTGTPVAMFDEAGREVWSATIDIRGNLRKLDGDRQACPFRWPGQYEDEETGLYYNRYRYYDPRTETYISRDPIGLKAGLNPYRYVPDPVTWFDPLGLAPITTWNGFQQATPNKFGSRQDAATGWKAYKESSQATKPLAIGRLPDTQAAEAQGFQRLNITGWNEHVNDAWIQGGIDAGKPFHLVSDPHDPNNLHNPPGSKYPDTIFKRELDQLEDAGYKEKGGCMAP